jgi:hypothetical protein
MKCVLRAAIIFGPTAHRVRLTKIKQISRWLHASANVQSRFSTHVHLLWYKCKQRPTMHTINIVCICTIVQKCSYLLILFVTALKCGPSYLRILYMYEAKSEIKRKKIIWNLSKNFIQNKRIYQQRKFSIFFD